MKHFEQLLNMISNYDEPTLWRQSVFLNSPKNKNYFDRNLERLIAELYYLHCQEPENEELSLKIETLSKEIVNQGNLLLTDDELKRLEQEFSCYAKEIKDTTIHLVSHAHIDMNWLWGYNETVDITIDTIKTMLKIMKDYPDFTYSHSQGSTYKIMEQYAPELIDEIKKYIKLGQFEVAATTWTEKDTNMTSTESYIKHLTMTRSYLKKLLDLHDEDFYIDFEPDTFGHSAEVPKLLSLGNVKYYYHCRGLNQQSIYRFTSSAGHEVLAFKDPKWYNNAVHPTCFNHIPKELKRFDIKNFLFVYGVGNHGGGPTIRDIEEIKKMQEWPLLPTLRMSTYKAFFESIEPYRERFPIVQHELNFTLTGCFTSSSRMKTFNKISENVANMTTYSDALAAVSNCYETSNYDNLWEKIMFNQFHDILPGCGIMQTREYAAGEFQKVLAGFNQRRKRNYQKIASLVDTTFLGTATDHTRSAFGAGNGIHPNFMLKNFPGESSSYYISQNCIDGSDIRYYVVFNPSASKVSQVFDLLVWDYDINVDNLRCFDSEGNEIKFILTDRNYNQFWGHFYLSLKIELVLEPLSYKTIGFKEVESQKVINHMTTDPRLSQGDQYQLKNDNVVIELDPLTCSITSYTCNGKEYAKRAEFVLMNEEAKDSSAWNYRRVLSQVGQGSAFDVEFDKNDLYQAVRFNTKFGDTTLNVSYTLPQKSDLLEVTVNTNWNFIGNKEVIPSLVYQVNCPNITSYMNDIAGGFVSRTIKNEDVPGLSFIKLGQEEEKDLFISSEEKYGYRIIGNNLIHNLIRSTTSPDTHPENHTHLFRFFLGVGTMSECIVASDNVRSGVEFINAKANQSGKIAPAYRLPLLKEHLKIVTVGVIDGNHIFVRYLALESFEYRLNEDETFIDIYGKELGETSKRIKKLDVVTIKKKMR
jgi:alpha-mannosidase